MVWSCACVRRAVFETRPVATLPSSRKRVPAIPAADTFGTANSVSANTSAWYEK